MLKDFTLEQIQEIATQSENWQEILNKLGYKSRGSLITIKTYFIKNNIECSLLEGIVTQVCPICGKTFTYQNKGGNRKYCFDCSPITKNPTDKFIAFKKNWIKSHGNGCNICGYNKCIDALDFHHIDPRTKKFSISNTGHHGIDELKEEAEKCIILCANCHREIHAKDSKFL